MWLTTILQRSGSFQHSGRFLKKTGVPAGQVQRVRADGIAQFSKGHLSIEPSRILRDVVHRRSRIIADQMDSIA